MTVKEKLLTLLQAQPEDMTYEEFLHEVALDRMIEQGMAEVQDGNTLPHDQVKKQVQAWFSSNGQN
jgi:predicted transcriptional regulator